MVFYLVLCQHAAAVRARPQTTAMVDIFTWGLLVPMLEANPDPVKVAHARELFYNFFSYNTVRAHALPARAHRGTARAQRLRCCAVLVEERRGLTVVQA
jgi:hypothetical protein